MKNPEAPFLEISFYFSNEDGNSSLEKLTAYLLGRGAVPKAAYTTDRTNSPLVGFDFRFQEHRIDRSENVWELLQNDNTTTIKIALEKGTRIIPDTREFVVQLPISENSVHVDHNPVALWLEGEALSYAPTMTIPVKVRRIGTKTLKVFRDAILFLQPTYAAITVDYDMECPTDLKHDPRTHAFRDFYIARAYVGEEGLSKIRQFCPGAYHEDLPMGQITCCSGFLAPDEIYVETSSAFELSEQVGRMISSLAG